MEFLGMIAVGVLGLTACGRLFGFMFKLLGRAFDSLEDVTLGRRRSRRSWYDDD
jgi:hypothetical protein